MKQSGTKSWIVFWVFLAALAVFIVWMARDNVLTFPYPSEDDSAFFPPAWNLAVHASLKPQVLNAPDGFYWMPHGYFLWLGFFLWLFGPTAEVAHTVNQITVAAAVALLTFAHARICRSRGFALLCACLLASPAVIIAANTIRFESLLFLLYSVAMLLHTYRRYLLAAEALCLSLVIHPALMFSAAFYLISMIFFDWGRKTNADGVKVRWIRVSDVVFGALVFAAIAADAALALRHLNLFRLHMGFQLHRKAARSLYTVFAHKRGILLILETLLIAFGAEGLRRRSRDAGKALFNLLPVAMAALGLQTYAAFGFEGPYAVYSYAVVPANLFCLAYAAVSVMQAECAAKTVAVT
jgi:hypothetical protein